MLVPILVAAVVLFLLARNEGVFATPADALGAPPGVQLPGGQPSTDLYGMPVPPQTSGGTPGNSEQNIAHGLEGLVGGVGGAGVCTYYGLGALAGQCAKVGTALAPTAVKVGNYTTLKTVGVAKLTTDASFTIAQKTTGAGGVVANKFANASDTVYKSTDRLPTPLALGAKAALLPIKVTADVGAKGAALATSAVNGLASGAKKSTTAVVTGVSKVLGYL